MTPKIWQQIEELYEAACGSNQERRAELLSNAEPGVRRAVERMLDQASGADRPAAWEDSASDGAAFEAGHADRSAERR